MILPAIWTTESFLAWEDRQEAKYEFDGACVVPMTGASLAHQDIVFNLRMCLAGLLAHLPCRAVQEMRLQAGDRVRYPDVVISTGPIDQTVRTLTDAVVIFEVLSNDTATIDRVDKLVDYANLPSLRCYVLIEQTKVAATLFRRDPGGPWIATAHTAGSLVLTGPDITLPLEGFYQGLTFDAEASPSGR